VAVPYKGKVIDSVTSSAGGFTVSDGKHGVYQMTI
jgi:hypothetical protein